jgi:hypothetical protein
VLGPAAAWKWQRIGDAANQLDPKLDFSFALDRWDPGALWARLESGELIAPPAASDALLRTTGRWPKLVDAVIEKCWPRGEVRAAVQTVEKELGQEGDLRRDFLDGLGIDVAPGVRGVVTFLLQEQQIDSGDLELGELLEPALTPSAFAEALRYLSTMQVLVEEKGVFRLDPSVARLLGAR